MTEHQMDLTTVPVPVIGAALDDVKFYRCECCRNIRIPREDTHHHVWGDRIVRRCPQCGGSVRLSLEERK